MFKADRLYNEIVELEQKVKTMKVDSEESLTDYFKAYTSLIFDYKQVGYLYDIYADDVTVYRENGNRLNGAHEVMKDASAFLASFPDLSITFMDAFAVKRGDVYKLSRSYYLDGTNRSDSQYGPPTFKTLDGEKCIVINLATIEIKNNRPQIIKEFTMYSSEWIRNVCTIAAE